MAGVIVPVMEKYHLTFDTLWAKWAPEVRLVVVVVPLIGATLKAIRGAEESKPAPAAASGDVTSAPARAAEPGTLRPNPA
jgi:hypothetical protein